MGRKVLVLNADYTAISVCTVPKAFLLVYLKKAELLKDDEAGSLRTVSATYPLPAVIKLHHYVNVPYKSVVLNRQNIFKRDGNKCVYCGNSRELTLDHVIPKSRGGKTNWDNLVAACRRCNSRKGHFTPEEAEMPLAVKPFKPTFVTFLRDFSGNTSETWAPYLSRSQSA
ncbi:HNH endonuclease [Jiulongibacter sediminis]|uniref:HNH endonuclease n=1 Tax=Jiulongibacter sediminis TaxID=1605367 RepID=A0A0P7C449_9BACT|nr:HNH endonuclease [Jiulongibacter sediminis]KPM46648.1 HNH endonuclease [Jiulongibacter sediminis]TBX21504.1 HNH endonuclease [Jiulongibacter sediminis]